MSKEIKGTKDEFIKLFEKVSHNKNAYATWSDIISMIAISIANTCDHNSVRKEKREQEYMQKIKQYLDYKEDLTYMFACIVEALENNPKQDFLGEIFMDLQLVDKKKQQFFTPYNVSEAMATMTLGDKPIDKPFESVCDPTCGSGVMLIASANRYLEKEVNYQKKVLFVGQDIDRVCGMMCYIQISLLGCPGYVVIGDSLTEPLTGNVLIPQEKEAQEFWFTPIYESPTWELKRILEVL